MSAEPIVLPPAPAEPRRPPTPFVAAIVPVVAGVILWQVSGSILALCFALLGPLMIGGSLLDGMRLRRRERKRIATETDAAWQRADDEIAEHRNQERSALWRQHPDALRCLTAEPLHEDEAPAAATMLVIGQGEGQSSIRLSGGEGERARVARQRARTLDDAPVVVRLGRGVCVRGPVILTDAVVRALTVQLCLRFPPSRLALVGASPEWGFAHAASRAPFRLGIGRDPEAPPAADAVLWALPAGSAVPEGITVVLDVQDPSSAELRTAEGSRTVIVECLSDAQLRAVAGSSARYAVEEGRLPGEVRFDQLVESSGDGLRAGIGQGLHGELGVDLIADGPHAMVTGMTGAGKSELLVTWVCAMAAARSPEEVGFVLADFKGGTAFDALMTLPHVSAVLTDLDESEAARGVRSLTAELRRRERVLAEAGARDIDDRRVRLPRLVIVVDEFAALLQEHPDLAAVFTDIAARGRALGMHLILGTQRAAGVIKDALAANCPLRISLRVADAADSRAVIGTDDAALIEGGTQARGIAFVRRPQDLTAQEIRVARTDGVDIARIGERWANGVRQSSPWLPALPTRVPLESLPRADAGAVNLGIADEPERQAQPVLGLRPGVDRGFSVIGGAGSGKSAVLHALQTQFPAAFLVDSDPERAWDAVLELASRRPELVLFDDVDRVLASLPGEYALAFAERLELFLRSARQTTSVLTFGRASGATARLLDALPERLLLRTATRGEHLAAGGETATFRDDRPPGRGVFSGRELQVAWAEPNVAPGDAESVPRMRRTSSRARSVWRPQRALVGLIGGAGSAVRQAVLHAAPGWEVCAVTAARREPLADMPGSGPDATGIVLIGDAEDWQREWALLQRIRQEGEALVPAEQPSALRTLLGMRELPPYARTHEGRAWRVIDGGAPSRVILPGWD